MLTIFEAETELIRNKILRKLPRVQMLLHQTPEGQNFMSSFSRVLLLNGLFDVSLQHLSKQNLPLDQIFIVFFPSGPLCNLPIQNLLSLQRIIPRHLVLPLYFLYCVIMINLYNLSLIRIEFCYIKDRIKYQFLQVDPTKKNLLRIL